MTRYTFRSHGSCLLMVALALTLGGCNSEWLNARDTAIQANTRPPAPSYKADIVAFMRTYLNDPAGVRDAFISEPSLRLVEGANRYTVCLRYSARNGSSKDTLVVFREGRLDRVIDAREPIDMTREACKDAAYVPFPELQRLAR